MCHLCLTASTRLWLNSATMANRDRAVVVAALQAGFRRSKPRPLRVARTALVYNLPIEHTAAGRSTLHTRFIKATGAQAGKGRLRASGCQAMTTQHDSLPCLRAKVVTPLFSLGAGGRCRPPPKLRHHLLLEHVPPVRGSRGGGQRRGERGNRCEGLGPGRCARQLMQILQTVLAVRAPHKKFRDFSIGCTDRCMQWQAITAVGL
jgi:hypothetical protein